MKKIKWGAGVVLAMLMLLILTAQPALAAADQKIDLVFPRKISCSILII
ncbi:hypothetical protein [Weizmannia acidilactici]|nr:hypothetical protein [Weizmannia acidilactici]